ncbi:YraN family protein [Lutibacter sp. B2]|nr:YraN family protein [Lutibacter sp. B2]
MSKTSKMLGNLGENMARKYLQEHGYKIVCSNYRCKIGEIDIIAYKNDSYIFVEVKTRRNFSFGRPIEAITPNKVRTIMKVAQCYMSNFKLYSFGMRFDAIEVIILPSRVPEINHIENIAMI